jgi:hypothetical protein
MRACATLRSVVNAAGTAASSTSASRSNRLGSRLSSSCIVLHLVARTFAFELRGSALAFALLAVEFDRAAVLLLAGPNDAGGGRWCPRWGQRASANTRLEAAFYRRPSLRSLSQSTLVKPAAFGRGLRAIDLDDSLSDQW